MHYLYMFNLHNYSLFSLHCIDDEIHQRMHISSLCLLSNTAVAFLIPAEYGQLVQFCSAGALCGVKVGEMPWSAFALICKLWCHIALRDVGLRPVVTHDQVVDC